MIEEYDALAARAFDEPYEGELRQRIRVCADELEAAGDPRGTLIALSEALDARNDPHALAGPTARDLRAALDEHVLAHHLAELGNLEVMIRFPDACRLEWRAGRLYGARLDTRYISRTRDPKPASVIETLLAAPIANTLRRLAIRVRDVPDAGRVLRALHDYPYRPPLDTLIVSQHPRPQRIAARPSEAILFVDRYPALQLLAQRDEIVSLPIDDKLRKDLAAGRREPPCDAHERAMLGRALTSSDAFVREAALARVGALREFPYLDTLMLLLQPRVVAPQTPVIECLAAIGPLARRALPVLIKVPGRERHYDVDTRRAAGKLVAALQGDVRSRRGA